LIIDLFNRLDHDDAFAVKDCDGVGGEVKWVGNAASDAQYLVAVGVISMLWSMAVAAVYLLAEAQYKSRNILPAVVRTGLNSNLD